MCAVLDTGVGGSAVAQGAGVDVGPSLFEILGARLFGVCNSPLSIKTPGNAVGSGDASIKIGAHPIDKASKPMTTINPGLTNTQSIPEA